MGAILYNLIIYPLEAIIEIVYLLFSRVTHSTGLAIAGVSLVVNVLTLPLYAKAERLQAAERETQKRLKPKVEEIKAVFQGDERLMILSTYYRQSHYHPIYALRSSFGLLLQIPFFIAAYAFLSSLPELGGRSFAFLSDLSKPDALLSLGATKINVLPLFMTLVNLLASWVYVRGLPLREKVQLYGMASIFLILLYSSPSGLVLYWTFNNLFSLFKNLVFRARRPLRLFYFAMAALAIGAAGIALFVLDTTARKRLVVLALSALVLFAPLLAAAGRWLLEGLVLPGFAKARERNAVFLLSAALLATLAGLAVPASLIASSPQEFAFAGAQRGPYDFILTCLLQAGGIFLFWPALLFALGGAKARAGIAALMSVAAVWALVDVFGFGGRYGSISPQLLFQSAAVLRPIAAINAANLGALALAGAAVLVAIWARKGRHLATASAICLVGLVSLSGVQALSIYKGLAELREIRSSEASDRSGTELEPVFPITRRGRNVFVIMLDRGISSFLPYAMKEDPALAERYRGFVWYPNTASYNGHTLAGAPPLYGGYEYRPEELNRRSGETLVSKHNEALSVMPRAFAEAGWRSTITDASWANYSWIPDNNIFRAYPGITALNLEGRYTQRWLVEHGMNTDPTQRVDRGLIRFSILKLMPMALRFGIYDQGKWWDSRYSADEYADYIDKYASLDYLPELLSFDEGKDTFALMVNNTAHDSQVLDGPSYSPRRNPRPAENPLFEDDFAWRTYQVNMASLRLIGDFLEELRAKGTYDNTRIVIVADHGSDLKTPVFAHFSTKAEHVPAFNPLLMIKDFGATAPLATDSFFRTNADTPALATESLGVGANPFTAKPFRTLEKGEILRIVDKALFDPSDQRRNTLDFAAEDIVTVRENIFVESNWSFSR